MSSRNLATLLQRRVLNANLFGAIRGVNLQTTGNTSSVEKQAIKPQVKLSHVENDII